MSIERSKRRRMFGGSNTAFSPSLGITIFAIGMTEDAREPRERLFGELDLSLRFPRLFPENAADFHGRGLGSCGSTSAAIRSMSVAANCVGDPSSLKLSRKSLIFLSI